MNKEDQLTADWKEFHHRAAGLFEGQPVKRELLNRLYAAFVRGWDAGFKAGQQQPGGYDGH